MWIWPFQCLSQHRLRFLQVCQKNQFRILSLQEIGKGEETWNIFLDCKHYRRCIVSRLFLYFDGLGTLCLIPMVWIYFVLQFDQNEPTLRSGSHWLCWKSFLEIAVSWTFRLVFLYHSNGLSVHSVTLLECRLSEVFSLETNSQLYLGFPIDLFHSGTDHKISETSQRV